MAKMYTGLLVKRFLVYPTIIGFITFHLLGLVDSMPIGELFREEGPIAIMEATLNVTMPFESVKFFYLYAVGFAYGTMSLILPVHKLKLGLIGMILMYLKLVLSMIAFAPIAMLWIPVELFFAGLFLITRKMTSRTKKEKKEYTLKELKEWANETA
ncbi:MAG: hypothetical protein N2A99_06490 [Carnobacterium alterfunditum]